MKSMTYPFYPNRNAIVLAYDALAVAISFVVALYMRLGSESWQQTSPYVLEGLAISALVTAAVFAISRTYRRVWRYYSLNDLLCLLRSTVLALVVIYVALFLATRLESLPRMVPLMHGMVALSLLCAPRLLVRSMRETSGSRAGKKVPVLLLGLSDQSEMFIREATRNTEFPYLPVALVTENQQAVGQSIHHVRVYGGYDELENVLEKLSRKDKRPQKLILCHEKPEGELVQRMLSLSETHGIPLARLPKITDFKTGTSLKVADNETALNVRPIDVEDLLGRSQTLLDRPQMHRLIVDKQVLVTGAGGSIGSELVRQIAAFQPSRLILLDHAEYNLYNIDRQLHDRYPEVQHKPILCDVRDADHVNAVWEQYRPDIVFHAAAIKHVPLSELNTEEAVLTNVMGTEHVARACIEHETERMVMISTDKAVNPANVMGATKRVAEMVCDTHQRMAKEKQKKTEFVTVRFGNVLGSAGSVVPMFQKQLEAGGPMTITSPDVTRYFMTIREAVELVVQAAALSVKRDGQAEQEASLYVLDMGEPVKIVDLAEQMVRLAGLKPYDDVAIKFIGLRPGEKLYEELFYEDESLSDTQHDAIKCGKARLFESAAFLKHKDALITAAKARDPHQTRDCLQQLVPEFQPILP